MKRDRAIRIFYVVFLSVGSVIMMYPLLFAVLGAVCSPQEYLAMKTVLPIPKDFSLQRLSNFILMFKAEKTIWAITLAMLRFVWYSATGIFTSVVGGYIFAKLHFRGKSFCFAYLLISLMVPGVATISSSFVILGRFPLVGGNNILGQGGHGFIDNVAVLFVTGMLSAYNIFLVRQCIADIDDAYREAAEMDGAGFLRIVMQIYLPMIRPIVGLLVISTFIAMWNDYMFPLMYSQGNEYAQPIGYYITVLLKLHGLGSVNQLPNYPAIFAISMTSMIPPIVVFILLQDQFVAGLTMGGIKT